MIVTCLLAMGIQGKNNNIVNYQYLNEDGNKIDVSNASEWLKITNYFFLTIFQHRNI